MRWWSRHHLENEAPQLAGLVAVAATLYLAAAVGMAYVAGFDDVRHALERTAWWWLPLSLAGVAVSFVGYYFGYRGIGKVEHGPDDLPTRSRLAVVVAGFGGFFAHGGSALDDFVMRAAGASQREAKVRVGLIAGLEHGMVAFPCTAAAIALLVEGERKPPLDFTIPWAVAPALGFAVAFWAAERYRDGLRRRGGWRGRLSIGLDVIHLVLEMFRNPRRHGAALAGMVLFWVSDMFALWAALAAFGFRMNVAAEAVAFGTAMIVTRRTGPLGGAGILMCALPPTLWYSGAPWAAAVLGVFAWRFFTLWVPMPLAFAALPHLRALGERYDETPAEGTSQDEREPALQH
jgi:uncharacterized membrane protein YbhN (UPF0104 family)